MKQIKTRPERMKLTDVGVFPLIKLGLMRFGDLLSNAFWLLAALLFGKRIDTKPDKASGSLYVVSSIVSVIGTVALVAVSFSGSFSAASDFAQTNGIDAHVASSIPIAVDGLIVLCILAIFSASLGGYSAGWLSLVVLVFTGISIYFNVRHMPEGVATVDRYLLGGAFPVIVFLASESTSWQIRKAVAFVQTLKTFQQLVVSVGKLKDNEAQAGASIKSLGEQAKATKAQIENYQKTLTNLERDLIILAVSADASESNSETIERRVQIIRIKESAPKTTQAQLAEMIGTSQKTISRDCKQLSNGIASSIINGK